MVLLPKGYPGNNASFLKNNLLNTYMIKFIQLAIIQALHKI
jgi:hypothetical protein